MVPLSMRSRWLMQRSIVDFPAPRRADDADDLARLHLQRDVIQHTRRAERLADAFETDHVAAPRGAVAEEQAAGPTCIRLSRYFTTRAPGNESPK